MSELQQHLQQLLKQLEMAELLNQQQQPAHAAQSLFQLLALLNQQQDRRLTEADYHFLSDYNRKIREIAERTINQWQLILATDLDFTQLDYRLLWQNMSQLHTLIMGTAEGNLDNVMLTLKSVTNENYTANDFLRLLLAWCPASRLSFDPFSVYSSAAPFVLAHAIALLAAPALPDEQMATHLHNALQLLGNEIPQSPPLDSHQAFSHDSHRAQRMMAYRHLVTNREQINKVLAATAIPDKTTTGQQPALPFYTTDCPGDDSNKTPVLTVPAVHTEQPWRIALTLDGAHLNQDLMATLERLQQAYPVRYVFFSGLYGANLQALHQALANRLNGFEHLGLSHRSQYWQMLSSCHLHGIHSDFDGLLFDDLFKAPINSPLSGLPTIRFGPENDVTNLQDSSEHRQPISCHDTDALFHCLHNQLEQLTQTAGTFTE